MADVIQVRRDTAENWASVNPVLHQGEEGLETDTGKEKTGDGSTAWNSLGYECGGGWLCKDFTLSLPPAGSNVRTDHGIPAGKIRNISANAYNPALATNTPPFAIEIDGTRTAHYNVYEYNGQVYVASDITLASSFVGATVYIRIFYIN